MGKMVYENVLITGASNGIGEACAYEFARNGSNLYLIARNEEKLLELKKILEKMYDVEVEIIVKDLSVKNAADEIDEQLKNRKIDLVINNAGVGSWGKFACGNLEKFQNEIDVNVVSLMRLTYFFLKKMLKENCGTIINVASIASFYPGPYMANYYATKAYVLNFSEALQEEVKDTNVRVFAFCPGLVKTEFLKSSQKTVSKNSFIAQDPQNVAKKIFKKSISAKRTYLMGRINRIYVCMIKFLPRHFVTFLSGTLQKRR